MIARVLANNNREIIRDEMSLINVSDEGIRIMEDKGCFFVIKISGVPLKAAIILKQEMLALGQECALSSRVASLSTEETDVLLFSNELSLKEAQIKLKNQPFRLSELSIKVSDALMAYKNKPSDLEIGNRKLTFNKTHIMGILNVTPDSFSDGGKYTSLDKAIEHALDMVSKGATIIDIGGESSRPNSVPVSTEEELKRVLPVVEAIAHETTAMVSVDTYKAEVAKRAIELGAHIINDITAMTADSDMAEVVKDGKVGIVLMHMRGSIGDMHKQFDYSCVVEDVYNYLYQRVNHALSIGISKENIIVDPGIGFSKTRDQNLELLNRLSEFKSLGQPLLVGTSKKSTVGDILNAPVSERLFGTASTVALSVREGANILRVHDVKEMHMVAQMSEAIIKRGERDEQ